MEDWFQTASPEDIAAYCDRERIFGEQKTLQWLANRNSNPRVQWECRNLNGHKQFRRVILGRALARPPIRVISEIRGSMSPGFLRDFWCPLRSLCGLLFNCGCF